MQVAFDDVGPILVGVLGLFHEIRPRSSLRPSLHRADGTEVPARTEAIVSLAIGTALGPRELPDQGRDPSSSAACASVVLPRICRKTGGRGSSIAHPLRS